MSNGYTTLMHKPHLDSCSPETAIHQRFNHRPHGQLAKRQLAKQLGLHLAVGNWRLAVESWQFVAGSAVQALCPLLSFLHDPVIFMSLYIIPACKYAIVSDCCQFMCPSALSPLRSYAIEGLPGPYIRPLYLSVYGYCPVFCPRTSFLPISL